MKQKIIVYLSLLISVVAIGYTAWLHHHAEEMAVSALRKREIEFVTYYTPKLRIAYADMLGRSNIFPVPPQTIEELFRPMVEMVNQLGDTGEPASTNTLTK